MEKRPESCQLRSRTGPDLEPIWNRCVRQNRPSSDQNPTMDQAPAHTGGYAGQGQVTVVRLVGQLFWRKLYSYSEACAMGSWRLPGRATGQMSHFLSWLDPSGAKWIQDGGFASPTFLSSHTHQHSRNRHIQTGLLCPGHSYTLDRQEIATSAISVKQLQDFPFSLSFIKATLDQP